MGLRHNAHIGLTPRCSIRLIREYVINPLRVFILPLRGSFAYALYVIFVVFSLCGFDASAILTV